MRRNFSLAGGIDYFLLGITQARPICIYAILRKFEGMGEKIKKTF
jgi:hypothetical protein